MRASFLAAGALVLALGNGPAWAQSKQDFMLVNATGYDISEVYVSPGKAQDWGSDILGEGVMVADESRNIQFHRQAPGCMWDLKVVYRDDSSSAVWNDFDLCTVSKIKITYNRSTGVTSATTE